jgi:DNA anti-recombination protein RmuC
MLALEERVHEIFLRLEDLTTRHERISEDVKQLQRAQGLIVGSIQRLSQELGAQREQYPLK